jgi:hypothetical protein
VKNEKHKYKGITEERKNGRNKRIMKNTKNGRTEGRKTKLKSK